MTRSQTGFGLTLGPLFRKEEIVFEILVKSSKECDPDIIYELDVSVFSGAGHHQFALDDPARKYR